MSENTPFGFGKFVPGFDFLQNITKGAQGLPQMPGLANWVAPTLNVEEVEKRISELKAVMFWLDQNRQALNATIQALEVQKMTLATLRGMNVSMTQLSEALTAKPAARAAAGRDKPEPASEAAEAPAATAAKARADRKGAAGGNGAAAIDPLQWWGALTQQFQEIAANALKDGAQKAAAGAELVAAKATPATAPATAPAAAARKSAPAKSPARKSRSK
jgi:hypothetical protein